MEPQSTQCKLQLTYPKHRFEPEDLLNFMESKMFYEAWDAQGYDLEDDLTSLQMCLMADPYGELIEDTGGLRKHRHYFESKDPMTVYYSYHQNHGIIYLNTFEPGLTTTTTFTKEQRSAIRISIHEVDAELDRRKTLKLKFKKLQ